MRFIFFVMLAGAVLFSSCKTMEPEPDVSLLLTLPEKFSTNTKKDDSPSNSVGKVSGQWWSFLGSDELNNLIDHALTHNFDLKALNARLAQAQANISKADAAFFPSLNFSFGGQKKGTQVKKESSSSSQYDGSHSWDSSLTGSYTLDAWGETKSAEQATVSTYKAVSQDLNTATLELTAKITQIWVDVIAVRNKKQILDQQIKTNNTLLKLLKLRFVNGRATALEVSQQHEALVEANSQVPLLEKQEQILLNALALLSGSTSAGTLSLETTQLPDAALLPKIGIPSDLLENRSDIQAARMRLTSAQWEIKVAKADLLPSFNLTAQALFSSGKLDLLFHNWVASLAASVAGPLFDGGVRRAEIDRVKAVAQEQVNLYAAVVVKAVFEVEDSLISIQKQDEYVWLLEQELAVTKVTLRDARVQYQNGQSSYLNYLIARAGLQRLERQLAGERAIRIQERISLYKALGWDGSLLFWKK